MNDYLSGIELYYTEPRNISGTVITVHNEDSYHIQKVMRHTAGDTVYITDGAGHIFQTKIISISKTEVTCKIEQTYAYKNEFSNLIFCIPRLKSADRLEFALEKCVELGITRFIVFQSARTIARSAKLERWNKIAIAAMKQSLRSYQPNINYLEKFELINDLEGEKILFDQKGEKKFTEYIPSIKKDSSKIYYFIFGPEGGLTDEERNSVDDALILNLTDNRLRSETAAVTAASLLSNL
jgi:16S rRNA (uracil1498-N3)-methyltransferase